MSFSNNSVLHKYTVWMSKQFYFKQLSLAKVDCLLLLYPEIGPSQVLPLRDKVDLVVMAVKGHSAFPKALNLLELHHQIV